MESIQVDMFRKIVWLSMKVDQEFRYHLDNVCIIVLDGRNADKIIEQLSVCSPPRAVRHESHKGLEGSHPATSHRSYIRPKSIKRHLNRRLTTRTLEYVAGEDTIST